MDTAPHASQRKDRSLKLYNLRDSKRRYDTGKTMFLCELVTTRPGNTTAVTVTTIVKLTLGTVNH